MVDGGNNIPSSCAQLSCVGLCIVYEHKPVINTAPWYTLCHLYRIYAKGSFVGYIAMVDATPKVYLHWTAHHVEQKWLATN